MTVVYLEDIDRIQYRFTELGKTITEISQQSKGFIDETTQTLEDGFYSLIDDVYADEAFQQLQDKSQVIDSSVLEMSKMFSSVISVAQGSFGELTQTASVAQQGLQAFTEQLDAAKRQEQAEAGKPESEKGGKGFGGWIAAFKKDKGKKGKGANLPGPLRKEIASLKSKVSGMMGAAKLPKVGTIAADGAEYAFGVIMYVPGYGYGRVEDRGGAIKGDHIDLYFKTHSEAKAWGKQRKVVTIWVP